MNDMIITKIIFGTLYSIGTVVLLIIDFKIFYKYLIQQKRCKSKTKGIVKKYTITSRGSECVHPPVVYYEVNGKQYKVVGPEYKGYKFISTTGLLNNNELKECYEDEKQRLIIKRSTNAFFTLYENPMRKLFPLNSEIDVFYDEKKPQLSYVLRYCNRKFCFWFTLIATIFVLVADISCIFFL